MLTLIGIIIIVSTTSFFVIKSLINKNKSLSFKLDYAEKEIKSINENIANYKKIIVKLNDKKKESEDVKKNIHNASGGDLSRLANSL